MVAVQYLQECFTYDPLTGLLAWKTRPPEHFANPSVCRSWGTRFVGRRVGNLNRSSGYLCVKLSYGGREHKLAYHRVAWAVHFGCYPSNEIDHINRVRTDNRLANLRDVSRSINQRNRAHLSSPHCGVRIKGRKFVAYMGGSGRQKYLGSFHTVDAAIAARRAATQEV